MTFHFEHALSTFRAVARVSLVREQRVRHPIEPFEMLLFHGIHLQVVHRNSCNRYGTGD